MVVYVIQIKTSAPVRSQIPKKVTDLTAARYKRRTVRSVAGTSSNPTGNNNYKHERLPSKLAN
jgi:hypothetical protein